jgi:exonuclease III
MITCLQEVKMGSFTPQLLAKIVGYRLDKFSLLPVEGTRGGVLLAWQSECIDATNLIVRDYSLTMVIKPKWFCSSFTLTTVYGPTDDEAKQAFLAELVALKPSPIMPWVVLGDFNQIYSASDKNNLNLNIMNMGRFRNALDSCEFFKLALQNRRYTWSNERQDPTLVRLDHAFYNKEWGLMLPGFSLQALSSSISDHCPILLCQQLRPKRKEVFRFESFWVKVPGFHEVVQQAWNNPVTGRSTLNILYYKLQNTARELKAWSRKLFGNARRDLHLAKEIIQMLEVAQESSVTPRVMKILIKFLKL